MSVSLSFSRSPLALSITLALASAAHAQGLVAPQPLSQDDSALTLGTISITSKASGPLSTRSVFSSVDIVGADILDRKSTRLNSSHLVISYAVFCLKKKNQTHYDPYYSDSCYLFLISHLVRANLRRGSTSYHT